MNNSVIRTGSTVSLKRFDSDKYSWIEYYSLPSCHQTHLTLQVPRLFSLFLSISCYFYLATHSSSPTRLMSLRPLFTFPISPTHLLSILFWCSSEMRWKQAVREVCGVCTCWGVFWGEVFGEIKERESLCETQKERGFVPAAGKHTEHCVWERGGLHRDSECVNITEMGH